MLILAVVAFVVCLADVAALIYATSRPADRPNPLPRPEPMPELYVGCHRAALMGETR